MKPISFNKIELRYVFTLGASIFAKQILTFSVGHRGFDECLIKYLNNAWTSYNTKRYLIVIYLSILFIIPISFRQWFRKFVKCKIINRQTNSHIVYSQSKLVRPMLWVIYKGQLKLKGTFQSAWFIIHLSKFYLCNKCSSIHKEVTWILSNRAYAYCMTLACHHRGRFGSWNLFIFFRPISPSTVSNSPSTYKT